MPGDTSLTPALLCALAGLGTLGCGAKSPLTIPEPKPAVDDPPAAVPASGCERCVAMQVPSEPGPVDMLFMIDNSRSMEEEQANLARELPGLVHALTTGDIDGDGKEDLVPVADLHLGVISSDMGSLGVANPWGCGSPGRPLSDDGILISSTRNIAAKPGCLPHYPARFMHYQAGRSDPEQLASDFACLATLHTEGCGFEQPLEAAFKALTPPSFGRIFAGDGRGAGQTGHGGLPGEQPSGVNAGFLRPDSLLVIVLLTDEDDCSSSRADHFLHPRDIPRRSSVRTHTPPEFLAVGNVRCFFNKQNLWPVERYVQGFQALRADPGPGLILAAIVGVPPVLVDAQARADFNQLRSHADLDAYYKHILDHPLMQEAIDPATLRPGAKRVELFASCVDALRGEARPPRRIVETVRGFGFSGVVASICQNDYRPVVEAILVRIAEKRGSCACR